MRGGSGGNINYLLLALLASSAVSVPGILFRLSACQQITICSAFPGIIPAFGLLLFCFGDGLQILICSAFLLIG